jgi:hypothetical protein
MMHGRWTLCVALLLACGGSDSQDSPDAAEQAPDASPGADAMSVSDAAAALSEMEPNNGSSVDDVNEVVAPLVLTGSIDSDVSNPDIDVFSVDLTPGQLWTWSLESAGTMAPHLAITNHAGVSPTTLGYGAAGQTASFDVFAYLDGRYNIIVRDSRNVNEGGDFSGPEYGYTLTATPSTRQPVAVTVPERVSATLDSSYDLALFSFSLTEATTVRIEVFARRKTAPSDIDSRLSLYYVDDSSYLITNDDPALNQLDSIVQGELPAGEYRVVVDNVEPTASDLSFELDFSTP